MFGQKQSPRPQPDLGDGEVAEALAPLDAVIATAIATPATPRANAPEGNETLVRSDLFKIIRTGVFASMNPSAAAGTTRDQMTPGVPQLVIAVHACELQHLTLHQQWPRVAIIITA